MSPQGAGTGKTPERVVKLLKEEVAKTNQSATARATGVNQAAIGRYIKGVGEPNNATLEKLSDYFKKPVWWLREDDIELMDVKFTRDKMTTRFRNTAAIISGQITVSNETITQVGIAVILDIQQGVSDEQIVKTVRGLEKAFNITSTKKE